MTLQECFNGHRKMWIKMLEKIGQFPSVIDRVWFKEEYVIKKHLEIKNECFFCEYAWEKYIKNNEKGHFCDYCPADWKVTDGATQYKCEHGDISWKDSSVIKVAEIEMLGVDNGID